MGNILDCNKLDCSWVLSDLALSGQLDLNFLPSLVSQWKITRLVDLNEDSASIDEMSQAGVQYLHLPTPRQMRISKDFIDKGVAWVLRAMARGEKTLVCGQEGSGRSAMMVCCVLVCLGYSPLQALILTKKHRPGISPSHDQLRALLEFAVGRSSIRFQTPVTWDEMVKAAYAS